MGKADVAWEGTVTSTMRGTGTQAQASREGFAEITSGRTISQQGLTATCKDLLNEAEAEGGRRVLVWRMSPYERRRRGNAFRGGARHYPENGNAELGQRGSRHSAAPGRPRTLSREQPIHEVGANLESEPQ